MRTKEAAILEPAAASALGTATLAAIRAMVLRVAMLKSRCRVGDEPEEEDESTAQQVSVTE